MTIYRLLLALILGALFANIACPADQPLQQIDYPVDYRNWIYLTSGLDMTYSVSGQPPDHHMFDNVFVNPEAYKVFIATGRWPDKTMLVKEVRGASDKASINKGGFSQSTDFMELEVHMKDEKRFPGQWGFFVFGDTKNTATTAALIPQAAQCYACHRDHGAVDNTFVQFYPTLLPVAESKKTLTQTYRSESSK